MAGILSEEVAQLKHLEKLNLSGNSLSGPHPAGIGANDQPESTESLGKQPRGIHSRGIGKPDKSQDYDTQWELGRNNT